MDLFELNKIVGAVLGAGLAVVVISQVGDLLVSPTPLEKNVYTLALQEEPEPQQETRSATSERTPTMVALLASGDAEAGRKVARKCASCHTFDQGGRNKIGPNLWDVVGRAMAGSEGFSYSGALSQAGGSWDYEALDRFLTKPREFIAGTKMFFAGLKKPAERANVILFLRSLSDSPGPLPSVE